MHKIWHKPLHTRKVWKRMTLLNKSIYYLQPFVLHLMYTWLQPLPFPTIFKLAYSFILIILMLMPILVPVLIMLGYYAIVQYLVESALDITYPQNLNIIHYLTQLFNFRIENAKYIEFINLYIERWRYIVTALASCVDYMRLVLSIVMR
ncbi:uncharacterized protein LOC111678161 isoform X1 [Lucilia cuprina]|uniref:uncharacterized protein LOC111678161 isoform X1 n=2 Tax=Lucilia cuprina TaxID=7375 RepID=UPI001F05E878|nr:uncharacterized protein LOC111678161 isoform X1 [Lucilia cuprina]